jgi:hypothetical protein
MLAFPAVDTSWMISLNEKSILRRNCLYPPLEAR